MEEIFYNARNFFNEDEEDDIFYNCTNLSYDECDECVVCYEVTKKNDVIMSVKVVILE